MARLKLFLLLMWLALASGCVWSQTDCTGNQPLEVAGHYQKISELAWGTEVIPKMFMVNASNVTRGDQAGISRVVEKFKLLRPEQIVRYTEDDASRAGVVYQTSIGEVVLMKTFLKRAKASSCVPGSSISGVVQGMPAIFKFVRSADGGSQCMWYLQVFDTGEAIDHVLAWPVACANGPDAAGAAKAVDAFKGLIEPAKSR